MASHLIVTHLSHDLQARKSYVSYVWQDDQGKRLGLEVPFGTPLAGIEAAAREALDALAVELQATTLTVPEAPI